jgi:hypothetical protein
MVKVDLKDVYFLVGVREYLCKFLRFSWNGRIFGFRCMAFGLAPAPRVFTKLMKVVVVSLRKKGIRLVIYLDDLLFFSKSRKARFLIYRRPFPCLRVWGLLLIGRNQSLPQPNY